MRTAPRLAITPGEPAGIGPDLVIQLSAQDFPAELIIIADPDLIQQRAKQLNIPVKLKDYSENAPITPQSKGELTILPVICPEPVTAGELNKHNASYVLETLERATRGCMSKEFSAIVTAPLHKGIINDAGIPFTGHTEFLAKLTNTPLPVMMLATEGLRVALATTHLPLSQVSAAITEETLVAVISILHQDLQNKFGIKNPSILICGLNPHAGEGGHLGMEEIEIIEPVIKQFQQQGLNLIGPLPADTLFTPKYLQHADAVLAMYHDQGLPVLKHLGFGKAINITLGLPIIRTSVDHGTALDLAGTGQAQTGSLIVAIQTAIEMSKN